MVEENKIQKICAKCGSDMIKSKKYYLECSFCGGLVYKEIERYK